MYDVHYIKRARIAKIVGKTAKIVKTILTAAAVGDPRAPLGWVHEDDMEI